LKASRSSLAKAPCFFLSIKRLLSQKSDCSCILIYFVRCIVFKDRCCLERVARDNVDYYITRIYFCQHLFSTFFVFNTKPYIPSRNPGFGHLAVKIGCICTPERAIFALSKTRPKSETVEKAFSPGASCR